MSGECNVCGQMGCVEARHCAFRAELEAYKAGCRRALNFILRTDGSRIDYERTVQTLVDLVGDEGEE